MADKLLFTLRILGHDVPVYEKEDLAREFGRRGHFDPVKMQIKVASGYADSVNLSTIIHEILEAIDATLDIDLKHDAQLTKLEAGLCAVIQDNKKVLKKLLK